MNDFQKNELIGRAKFKALLLQKGITDYHLTEGEFDAVDCYFNYNHRCYIAEIKVRKHLYSTLFMEKTKLKKMIEIISKGEAKDGYYVNFIGDKAYLFSIRRIYCYLKSLQTRPPFVSRMLPKTTSGNTEMVWKEITELPLNLAITFNTNEETMEKNQE